MNEKKDSGTGPGSYPLTGTGTQTGAEHVLFDHEKFEVYRVAREFIEASQPFARRKMTRELRDQFERASVSIVARRVPTLSALADPGRPDAEPALRRPTLLIFMFRGS
jgi:hypothetical protein